MADQRAPGMVAELPRLAHVGARLLGIVGDANHTYGYHVPSSRVAASDYSMQGVVNRPVGDYACAIDIGMGWPASRTWLRWLIAEIAADRIKGIAEVIGSYDGRNVRYWSDRTGWATNGVAYQGNGHDTWTHVAIYRSTARIDHKLLDGWGPNGLEDAELNADEKKQLAEIHAALAGGWWDSWLTTDLREPLFTGNYLAKDNKGDTSKVRGNRFEANLSSIYALLKSVAESQGVLLSEVDTVEEDIAALELGAGEPLPVDAIVARLVAAVEPHLARLPDETARAVRAQFAASLAA